MKIWVTSDNHFNHENIIKYCKRPFHSLEEMNNTMIRNWNKKVSKEDLVIHLGDFGFGSSQKLEEIRKLLNGIILILAGNHESYKKMENCNFIVIRDYLQIKNFIFTHKPLIKEKIPKGFINVHGHIHEKDSLTGVNVCVEKNNYAPILLDDLIALKKNYSI